MNVDSRPVSGDLFRLVYDGPGALGSLPLNWAQTETKHPPSRLSLQLLSLEVGLNLLLYCIIPMAIFEFERAALIPTVCAAL